MNKSLREIVRSQRKCLKISQVELAKKTGINQGKISQFEAGKVNLTSANVEKILDVLSLQVIPKKAAPLQSTNQ